MVVVRSRAFKEVCRNHSFFRYRTSVYKYYVSLLFDILTYKINYIFFIKEMNFSLFLWGKKKMKILEDRIICYKLKNLKESWKINHFLHRGSKYVYLKSFQFSLLFILPMISSNAANRARHIDHHRLYVEKMWNYRS